MIKHSSSKSAGVAIAIGLFSGLMAQGQAVENLVFTEQGVTVLTETLNGVLIGDWQYNNPPYGGGWTDLEAAGALEDRFVSSSAQRLDFLDPIFVGTYVQIFGGIYGEGMSMGDVLADGSYPGVPTSDYLSYADTGAEAYDAAGDLVPVNIQVQTTVTTPDEVSSIALLGFASVILATTRKHFPLRQRVIS